MKGFRKILQLCCRFERQEVNIEAESVGFCFRLPLTEALEARKLKIGNDQPDTLESLHDFGVMYLEQGRYEQAETKLLAAYAGRSSKLGPEHPMTLKSLKNLIQLYESWNKPEEAEKWCANLLHEETTKQ